MGKGHALTGICFNWRLRLMCMEVLQIRANMHICIRKTPRSPIGQKKICHRWVIPFDEYLVNRPWQAWWCGSLESGCNRLSIFIYLGFPQSPQRLISRFGLRFGGGSCPKTIAPSPENAAFSRDCSRNCCECKGSWSALRAAFGALFWASLSFSAAIAPVSSASQPAFVCLGVSSANLGKNV